MVFKFRLETVLRLKRLAEKQEVECLGKAREALATCQAELEAVSTERERARRNLLDGLLSGDEFAVVACQLESLDDHIRALEAQRAEREQALARCVLEAQTKMAERQSHEKIKERAHDRFKKEQAHAELLKMDEIGSIKHHGVSSRENDHE